MHISGMLCSILHGLGKAKQVLFVNLLTCAIRILMIMLLVPHYGIDAYLWAMLVSHVFMTLAVAILTCHTAHKKKSLHILQAYRNMCRLIKLQIIHVKGTHLFLYQS